MAYSSSHHFHADAPISARFRTGKFFTCASLEADGWIIDIHVDNADMRDRLKRAVEAFNHEMQREPVAQAAE